MQTLRHHLITANIYSDFISGGSSEVESNLGDNKSPTTQATYLAPSSGSQQDTFSNQPIACHRQRAIQTFKKEKKPYKTFVITQ